MPFCHPFTVHVNRATSEPFEEYKVSTNGNNIECYIESTAGTEFALSAELGGHFRDVCDAFEVHCYVDGHEFERHFLGDSPGLVKTSISHHPERRMAFANTQFSEDAAMDEPKLSSIGEIEIKILRVSSAKFTEGYCRPLSNRSNQVTINEKAKKALVAHSVQLSTTVAGTYKTRRVTKVETRLLDSADKPWLSFKFRYRSKDILEALDIIPRTAAEASDGEAPASSDFESSDSEIEGDVEAMAAKLRRVKNELRILKRKSISSPPIKEEFESPDPDIVDLTQPQVKKPKIMIDLTD